MEEDGRARCVVRWTGVLWFGVVCCRALGFAGVEGLAC